MKMIVLSDLHLKTSQDTSRDLGNTERFETAIDRINSAYSDADLVVVAGDLADRGRYLEPYETFVSAIAKLDPPHAVTLGNHDARENYVAVAGTRHCDKNGFVQSCHEIDGTFVIILDSVSDLPAPSGFKGARSPAGQLCDQRLTWLDKALEEAAGRPVIVILHHPPLQLQINSDDMALEAPNALIDRLVAYGNVRHVISGHIHMTTTAFHRGVPFTTIAGNFSTTSEDFGSKVNKQRRTGPAQMAVVLSGTEQTTIHFNNYCDDHPLVTRSY